MRPVDVQSPVEHQPAHDDGGDRVAGSFQPGLAESEAHVNEYEDPNRRNESDQIDDGDERREPQEERGSAPAHLTARNSQIDATADLHATVDVAPRGR